MDDAASTAWANPSSTHAAGRAARRLLEAAREDVAKSIGASPADLVFTSGGTAACNLGIRGIAEGCKRVLSTDVEHPAVAESVWRLGDEGRERIAIAVLAGQPPSGEELARHLGAGTLVAVQWVNHETGTVFPVHEYAAVCREQQALLFVDASQALGKLPIDISTLGADAVALGAQKIGGPPGAGACWIRRGLDVFPVLTGGSQERGRWPGTPDTLSMVGFGAACRLTQKRLGEQARVAALRDRLEASLLQLGGVRNGAGSRTGTVSNISFAGWEGPLLVAALDLEGVCVSTGAACSSGLQEPSAVIRSMYPDEQWRAGSAVRISLGIETSEQDIETALLVFRGVLGRKLA
jgi:cysteine desulfurase